VAVSPAAARPRGVPGSGLGLVIVGHVAGGRGGVCAAAAPGGGACLRLALPS
jgi:hypothetical protein